MKLSTKELTSLLLAATMSAMPGVRRLRNKKGEHRYERVLQKHDRKAELRASVLGIAADEFRLRERRQSFEEIAKSCGFASERAFHAALAGKLKAELRLRGWTPNRIERYTALRLQRASM